MNVSILSVQPHNLSSSDFPLGGCCIWTQKQQQQIKRSIEIIDGVQESDINGEGNLIEIYKK